MVYAFEKRHLVIYFMQMRGMNQMSVLQAFHLAWCSVLQCTHFPKHGRVRSEGERIEENGIRGQRLGGRVGVPGTTLPDPSAGL